MTILSSIYSDFVTESGRFNLDKFVQAVLLFEEVQLSNMSLVPQLVRSTGVDGFVHLLDTNVVRLVAGGPNAQATCDYTSPGFFRNRASIYQPLNFAFETIFVDPDHPDNPSVEERLEHDLTDTRKLLTVSDLELSTMIDSAVATMQVLKGQSLNVGQDFQKDVESHQPFIVSTLIESLARQNIPIHAYNWYMKVEQVDDVVYRVDTNLPKLLRTSEQEIHKLVKPPFFELTGVNLQIRRMSEVQATSGLTERQSALISKRVHYLSRILTEADKRPTMTRVVDLADVPELVPLDYLDVDELLYLRDSDEARIFRDYIKGAGDIDDEELRKVLRSWRLKLGEKWKAGKTQSLRWLASTGAGPFIEPVTGVALSIADQFLGRLLGDMGPIGFIDSDYRRFVNRQKKIER